jgi:crotonobetainyl-CoA:carnitine CoA-transferase CaiB-like acyl-CoA transferase
MTRNSAPEAGLRGLRVIEIARGMAAAFAGKVLADLGATVLKVEPPAGDPLRHWGPFPGGRPDPESSLLFAAVHAGKRSAVLDLESKPGQERLTEWASRADLLVHDVPPPEMAACGLDYVRLAEAHPGLVMLSISPFGLTGPRRDYAGCELTAIHSGGWGWLSPGGLSDPALPPLKPFGQQALIQSGIHGAVAALAAARAAQAGSLGEHIDLSVQEVVAGMLEMNLVKFTYAGEVATRLGSHLFGPWGFYPCRDGWIFLVCIEEDQWTRLVELMGRPEWAGLEVLADVYSRGQNSDFLGMNLSEWTAEWRVMELFHACQQRRICAAPVFTLAQLAEEPHLRDREFFVRQEQPGLGPLRLPGAPWRLERKWWALRGPAPALGEAGPTLDELLPSRSAPESRPCASASVPLPLEGVRVLDLSWVWAGPYCTMHLAHLGAEVIKIESGLRPDLGRRVRIYPPDVPEGLNTAGYFNQWGQGKKSVTVNLGTQEGVELVKRLAAHCDVVVDNFATGVTERLGLSPEAFQALKPGLIVASISGYGKTGPLSRYMGYGPSIPPLGGLTSVTGYADGAPREIGISYGDPNGGIHAALAIVAALYAQRNGNGGKGQVIDGSLWEAMVAVNVEAWAGHLANAGYRPMGNRDPRWAPHNLYRCAGEDAWIAIACTQESHWSALAEEMGQPGLARDACFRDVAARKANEDALDALIAAWVAPQERWELTRRLQKRAIPAFPSLSAKDLVEDEHLQARGYFARLPHAEAGVRAHSGIPWRLARRGNGVRRAAPLLGEHTLEVLSSLLGLSTDEIEELRRKQVLA